MNKFIFTLLSLTFMLFSLTARDVAPQPIVTQFLTEELTVYEHLSTILESAMQLAMEHGDNDDLHNNVATREIILTQAMTGFLDFDVKNLNEELMDSNVDNFVNRVINLFKTTSVDGMTVDVQSIESSRPDVEEVSGQLRQMMIGYYFAIMKEHNFDENNLKVDWKFNEIQQKMQTAITAKLNELASQFQQMMFNEMVTRAKNFTASFKVHHQQVVFILKSFKNYAMKILIEQIRTFYFNLTQNTNAVQPSQAKDVFQRTIDMWMIAYKLCERDCETQHFATFIPNFLEDFMFTRIEHNKAIVSSPLVKTFFAKFMSFLFQKNFQNNTPEEDDEQLMDLNERYAMFIYRLFFSKGNRKMNKKLSNFMNDLYTVEGLNFLYPKEDLQSNPEEFNKRKEMNQQYIIDLILHLDFPDVDNEEVQDAEKERTQPISFTEEDVLTLVQAAPVWFAFDLDKLNTEEIILNWFVDYNNPAAFEDYQVMYITLGEFRRNYTGEEPGEDLDVFLQTFLVDSVDELDRNDPKRVHNLSKYWLMKSINMINILSGTEYDETFSNAFGEEVNEDIILYFRRIIQREEFSFLKKAMLQIYAYYKEDGKVYTTDMDNDKFLYDVFDMSIECEKLPEILGTEVTTINVTFKDDEHVMDIKKKLDNGSSSSEHTSPMIVEETSSNTQSDISEHTSSNKQDVMDRERNRSHESSDVNISPLISKKSSEHTKESSMKSNIVIVPVITKTSEKSSPKIDNDSEQTSKVVVEEQSSNSNSQVIEEQSSNSNSQVDIEEISENRKSSKSKISRKTSEVVVEVSSNNSSVVNNSPINKSPKKDQTNPIKDSSYSSSQVSEEQSVKDQVKSNKTEEKSVHTPQEIVETSSNSSRKEVQSNQSSTKNISRSNKTTKIEESSNSSVIETSSNNSSPVVVVSEHSTPRDSKTNKTQVIEQSSNTSSQVDIEETSNNSQLVHKKSKISSQKTSHSNDDNSQVIPTNNSTKTPSNKTSEVTEKEVISVNSSNKSDVQDIVKNKTPKSDVESEHSVIVVNESENSSVKVSVNSSPDNKSFKTPKSHISKDSIRDEIEEQVINTSSKSSPDNSSESSHVIILPNVSPKSSEIVHEKSEPIDTKKNLVYEVTGRLTPEQKRTFEFADDVYASIKDLKLQVDEEGNEVEYVYVQIVRKDSDCYEELLKYP